MNLKFIASASFVLATLLFYPAVTYADLPTKTEIVIEQYGKARAQGIARLNKQYIGIFKKEQAIAMRAKRLADANALQKKIDELEAENKKLREGGKSGDRTGKEFTLLKKTISFPHERQADFMVKVQFKKDAEATFIGLGNYAVRWTYEVGDKPSVYYFWSHAQGGTKQSGYRVDVNSDGKTATVSKPGTAYSVKAAVSRTR